MELKKLLDMQKETNVNSDLKILPPYYFMIESSQGIISYCGVLDFTSDEDIVLIPNFILNQMGINGSDFIKIKYIGNIPKCSFVILEPQDKFIFENSGYSVILQEILQQLQQERLLMLLSPEQSKIIQEPFLLT